MLIPITFLLAALSGESLHEDEPGYLLVAIDAGYYRVSHLVSGRRKELYTEPYDIYEIAGMEPVIADIWPAPGARAFAFLRFIVSGSRTLMADTYKLALYDVEKQRRYSLFSEDSLPDISTLRKPSYLTWNSGLHARYGVVLGSEQGRVVTMVQSPVSQDFMWDIVRECPGWPEYFEIVKPHGHSGEIKRFDADSFEFIHRGKSIRWNRTESVVVIPKDADKDGSVPSNLWKCPDEESIQSLYYDGYSNLAVVTAKKKNFRGLATDMPEWAADYSFTTHVLDLNREVVIAVHPNVYIYRAVPPLRDRT